MLFLHQSNIPLSSNDAGHPAGVEPATPDHGGNHASLRRLRHTCEMASNATTTTMEEALRLKGMLAAGRGELVCEGNRYAVTVHVERNDVWVSARRLDLAADPLVRFMRAVADVFRRRSFRTRAHDIGQMLTAVVLSPVVAEQDGLPRPQTRVESAASKGEARRKLQKERAAAAVKAIRAETRARQREKGISGNLARDYPKVDLSKIAPADMDCRASTCPASI